MALKSSCTKSEIRFCRCVQASDVAPTALAADLVEQEVREGEAGEGAAVAEEAEQAVVAGVEPTLIVAQELAAELEGVAPFSQVSFSLIW